MEVAVYMVYRCGGKSGPMLECPLIRFSCLACESVCKSSRTFVIHWGADGGIAYIA